jgi:hypothetical protein
MPWGKRVRRVAAIRSGLPFLNRLARTAQCSRLDVPSVEDAVEFPAVPEAAHVDTGVLEVNLDLAPRNNDGSGFIEVDEHGATLACPNRLGIRGITEESCWHKSALSNRIPVSAGEHAGLALSSATALY